jgi:glycosidase
MSEVSIEVLVPSGTIKHRKNEQLHVEVLVQGSHQNDLIVELWAAIRDDDNKQEAAYPLEFQEERDDGYVFSADVTLPYTGYFPLKFRVHHTDHQHWSWAKYSHDLWIDPEYMYEAIVYNAFVRYFGGRVVEEDGEVDRITSGTFEDLRNELVNLKELGVNVLYLNPVHMIGELYRNYNPHDLLPEYLQPGCPYSIKDYKSIDPELSFGENHADDELHPFDEFHKFVDLAHELGLRVYMDLVFNHSAHDAVFQRAHPEWFLYKEDIYSLEAPFLYPEEIKNGKPWGDAKHTFSPYDHGLWWKDAAQLNWNNLYDIPESILPRTRSNNPPENPTIENMYAYFINIVKFWIREFGIDGFRCDVAYKVPMDFWKRCIIEARQCAKEHQKSIDNDVVFVAESFYVFIPELFEAGFSAVYGDISNKMHNVAQLSGYVDYMMNVSEQLLPENCMFFTFPECHDFHRNPSKIAEHFREEHEDVDLNANTSRWVLTATLPGMPMIFNGFEKMEWQPASLFSYSSIDWESDKDIRDYIATINHIRHEHIALREGRYHYLHTSQGVTEQSQIMSFARIHNQEIIIVCTNMDVVHAAQHVIVYLADELSLPEEFTLIDTITGKEYERSGNELTISLAPGESHIFEIKKV